MRLLTFSLGNGRPTLGGLNRNGDVISLQRCLGQYLLEVEGIERGEEIASALIPDNMTGFIRGGSRSLEAAKQALAYAAQKERELRDAGIALAESKITYWPPIPRPAKIICPGMNFVEHASEIDLGIGLPEFPVAFFKVSSALLGHKLPVVIKRGVKQVDYEVEVAVVIDRRAEDVPEDKSLDFVFGYSVFNDVSAREIQLKEMTKGMLTAGKNFNTFAPMGPYLVTRDEVANPGRLSLSLKVNGEVRQKSNTDHMVFGIPKLISYWSSIMPLEPGDVITTGTPAGVALGRKPDPMPFYLKPGDLMEAEVEGLGTLVNPVKKE